MTLTTMPAGLVQVASRAMSTLGLRMHRGDLGHGHHGYKTDVSADREYLGSIRSLPLDDARWLRALFATALALTSERIAELSPDDGIQLGTGYSDTARGVTHSIASGPDWTEDEDG